MTALHFGNFTVDDVDPSASGCQCQHRLVLGTCEANNLVGARSLEVGVRLDRFIVSNLNHCRLGKRELVGHLCRLNQLDVGQGLGQLSARMSEIGNVVPRNLTDPHRGVWKGRGVVTDVSVQLLKFRPQAVCMLSDGMQCRKLNSLLGNFLFQYQHTGCEECEVCVNCCVGRFHMVEVRDVLPALVALVVIDAFPRPVGDIGVRLCQLLNGCIEPSCCLIGGGFVLRPVPSKARAFRQCREHLVGIMPLGMVFGVSDALFQHLQRGGVKGLACITGQ